MLQNELETLLGRHLEPAEWQLANYIYMGMDTISKDEFAVMYQNKAICNDVEKLIDKVKALQNDRLLEEEKNASRGHKLVQIYHQWNDSSLRDMAIELLGINEYLRYTIVNQYELTEQDRADIVNNYLS